MRPSYRFVDPYPLARSRIREFYEANGPVNKDFVKTWTYDIDYEADSDKNDRPIKVAQELPTATDSNDVARPEGLAYMTPE